MPTAGKQLNTYNLYQLQNDLEMTFSLGWGGGLPYITDDDARRHFQKKPLKVTILGVAPANFVP